VIALQEDLERRLEELEKEKEEIEARLAELPEGWLEYKWVKNKVGARYRYWYRRVREGSHVASYYIGPWLPKEYQELFREKRRLRARLAEINREIREIRRRLRKRNT